MGYAQKEGIDYEETFAPVASYTSIRSVVSLATQMGWEIHQMDVKTTLLNGVIEEEVYIEQPKGFETHENKSHVCRLKKSLHGLKHPKHGTVKLTGTCSSWNLSRVMQIPISTI